MTQIFRMTHIDNLPFILNNGLCSLNSKIQDCNFILIGYQTLINDRKKTEVPINPGGTLSDYIPFYFWYKSPMLYVIYKGNDNEVYKTPQEKIVYIVSSIEKLLDLNTKFVFTDRHAHLKYANFYNSKENLNKLNWNYIKSNDWSRIYGPEIRELKQAECLVYRQMPIEAFLGIAVMNEKMKIAAEKIINDSTVRLIVKIKPEFYF
ncbi:MAG TPA: DUF4433 domain-containing protein [Ignavibacteria bacterium]|nr:DUF4433 domain-containing protein [Ignavibacteria bacterium]